MKKNTIYTTKKWIKQAILMFCLVAPLAVWAQPDPPGDDPGVPIDGGLSILLAAGVGYGAKKIHDNRKKNKDNKLE